MGNGKMSLQIGELVVTDLYPEKGIGKVVNTQGVFNTTYLEVFFLESKALVQIPENQAKVVNDPFTCLTQGQGASPCAFLVKYLTNEIEALLTKQGVVSAANFRITPLPHQILAVDFILSQFRPRCLIADEVGLGKTIEGAMVFEELKMRGLAKRILIITPSGLTQQWKEEMKQKFDEDFIVLNRELFHSLREIHGKESNVWLHYGQVITSLDFIKPKVLSPFISHQEYKRREEHNKYVFEMAAQGQWDVVLFDEAHKLSKARDGSETARYKIGEKLSEIAPVFLLLSATPHQGEAGKFFHLLNLIDPIAFSSMDDVQPQKVREYLVRNKKRAAVDHQGQRIFKQRISTLYPVQRNQPGDVCEQALYEQVTEYAVANYNLAMGQNDRAFGFLMILFQRMVSSSSRCIFKALSKRLAKLRKIQESLDFTSNDEEFDEEEAQDRSAEELLGDLEDVSGVYSREGLQKEINILESLVNLAQMAAFGRQDSKVRGLLGIIDEVCRRESDPKTKFLIFTEFIETQNYLAEVLETCGYEIALLNGRMNTEEKMMARNRFREDAQFLISTDAGGEGINLQFCHVIVNYDLPWNPMRIEQRIGRLDRIGQKYNVLVFNFLIEGTVEERVRAILENKLQLIKEQFGEDKLADILSTLQDDFNFDKLYIDAVIKREKEAKDLETIAQQIYERAQTILSKDDLLLPQSSFAQQSYQEKLLEVTGEKVKALVNNYLLTKGQALQEYNKKRDIYYFDFPSEEGSRHYQNVVFNREKALENDSLDYFHFQHPFVKQILADFSKDSFTGSVANLHIHTNEPFLIGQKGFWAIYRLQTTNNLDYKKIHLFSVYLDEFGFYHREISRYLQEKSPYDVSQYGFDFSSVDLRQIKKDLDREANEIAGNVFSEEQLKWQENLDKEKSKLANYFSNQEKAIQRIGIENIREGKLKEMAKQKQASLDKLKIRANLMPKLELVQIATVIFG